MAIRNPYELEDEDEDPQQLDPLATPTAAPPPPPQAVPQPPPPPQVPGATTTTTVAAPPPPTGTKPTATSTGIQPVAPPPPPQVPSAPPPPPEDVVQPVGAEVGPAPTSFGDPSLYDPDQLAIWEILGGMGTGMTQDQVREALINAGRQDLADSGLVGMYAAPGGGIEYGDAKVPAPPDVSRMWDQPALAAEAMQNWYETVMAGAGGDPALEDYANRVMQQWLDSGAMNLDADGYSQTMMDWQRAGLPGPWAAEDLAPRTVAVPPSTVGGNLPTGQVSTPVYDEEGEWAGLEPVTGPLPLPGAAPSGREPGLGSQIPLPPGRLPSWATGGQVATDPNSPTAGSTGIPPVADPLGDILRDLGGGGGGGGTGGPGGGGGGYQPAEGGQSTPAVAPPLADLEAFFGRGADALDARLERSRQDASRRLSEHMASRGTLGSSIEGELMGELEADLAAQRQQGLSDLMGRQLDFGLRAGGLRLQERALDLQRVGMDRDEAFRYAQLEQDGRFREIAARLQATGMSMDEAYRRAELEFRQRFGEQELGLRERQLDQQEIDALWSYLLQAMQYMDGGGT